MSKRKLPLSVIILAALAVGLLGFSTVGGARAALTYFSDVYSTQFEMYDIGITLHEYDIAGNDTPVSWRYFVGKDEAFTVGSNSDDPTTGSLLDWYDDFEIGKTIPEVLTVSNSGSIDEYVRVTVTKYWYDSAHGVKRTDLNPKLINIEFDTSNGWIIDEDYTDQSGATERTTLYYTKPIKIKEETPAFTKSVTIEEDVRNIISENTETVLADKTTVIKTTYVYDDLYFVIEARADGVQTHNAVDAIKSAWGRDVTVTDGVLSLN